MSVLKYDGLKGLFLIYSIFFFFSSLNYKNVAVKTNFILSMNLTQIFSSVCDVHQSVTDYQKRKKHRVGSWFFTSVVDSTLRVFLSKIEADEHELVPCTVYYLHRKIQL